MKGKERRERPHTRLRQGRGGERGSAFGKRPRPRALREEGYVGQEGGRGRTPPPPLPSIRAGIGEGEAQGAIIPFPIRTSRLCPAFSICPAYIGRDFILLNSRYPESRGAQALLRLKYIRW
jgi:hypothetical protein